tara:strand:+ start:89496 stop:90200 length:705 start_codon:yes stop_codon:yes gene_type:complete
MIQYIIVDDEDAAHDIIEGYGKSLPNLMLKKHCYTAFEAMEYLNNHKVDLIFLDINMPKLSGFEFLKTIKNPPKIIVTTAYSEFALEGYELSVSDYLLKPFSFQRFISAVNKVSETLASNVKSVNTIETEVKSSASIFLKDNKKYFKVKLEEILFAEAYGNYVKVQLPNQVIITHQTLSAFEGSLPESQFVRTHKSYIVSIDKIEVIEGNRIQIKEHTIPIGKMYKLNVNKLLK